MIFDTRYRSWSLRGPLRDIRSSPGTGKNP